VRVAPEGELLKGGGRGAPGAEGAAQAAAPGGAAAARGDLVIERLPGRALLPGFVNAHSHAFQRLIRGRTQWRPASAPQADFWSWREAMYAAALALSPEEVYDVSRACFLEMLHAGYTTVGEFHYLQRDPEGERYADPNELAHRVIAAAGSVGIRISLLNVCYATGGIDQSLLPEQRRFNTPDAERFLLDTGALREHWSGHAGVSVGIAPHSVRAVPRAWLPELHAWARFHDLPFHIHASEQPAEVEAALAAWGLRPVELLDAEGVLDERLTAVHATHLTPAEVALLGDAGATVCACPTTERDLGDGFLLGSELLAAGARIALGSDSQTVLDPFEELRLVEYHERLRRLRRVVLAVPGEADRLENAPPLLEMGTESGARSLRLETGSIDAGLLADLVAVDLEHPTLAGFTPEYLAATLALSAPAAVVSDVWVGGVRRVESRRHPLDGEAPAALRGVAARIP
jgi:formimidoylglutamate deiminase